MKKIILATLIVLIACIPSLCQEEQQQSQQPVYTDIIPVTSKDQYLEAVASSKKVLIFWGTFWNWQSTSMKNKLLEIKQGCLNYPFYQPDLELEETQEFYLQELGVHIVPSIYLYENGKQTTDILVGYNVEFYDRIIDFFKD